MNYLLIIKNPLDQFDIKDLLSWNAHILGDISLSVTNIGLYLNIAGYVVFTFSLLSSNNSKLVPNAWSTFIESINDNWLMNLKDNIELVWIIRTKNVERLLERIYVNRQVRLSQQ